MDFQGMATIGCSWEQGEDSKRIIEGAIFEVGG